jgi:glycine/D-amino acid oxidase-like deaminating enzyme
VDADVIIIGAGISGLACALAVRESRLTPLVLDASDAVGGRIRTDGKAGFLLDRGFQVLQTWYPQAHRMLDYASLDLRPFDPGALVRFDGRFHRVTDVWRRPSRLLQMAMSPVATPADKVRMVALRWRALQGDLKTLYERPETDALTRLQELGFSPRIIERFFKPFFAGVFFEPDLAVSSRAFEFVFRAFALGDTALPARGMGEIPAQLAAKLPTDSIRLRARVRRLLNGQVVLENGGRLRARALVLATDAREAARLLGKDVSPETRGTTCFYFAAERRPFPGPYLALNGERGGLINSLLVPSNLSGYYAPPDRHLVTVNLFGAKADPDQIEPQLRRELVDWFGAAAKKWDRLAVYRLPNALPRQAPPTPYPAERDARLADRLWICSELGGAPSIQWALHSGARAGRSVSVELLGPHTLSSVR